MSSVHNPYHDNGTHGAVISTTVGMAIQNLHREIERRDPEWFSISEVPVAQLAQLGLSAYFDSEGRVIRDRLPPIYRENSSTVSVLGSAHLSKGSLLGLKRLLGLEPNFTEPSQNFKDFAIGVFLRCKEWDEILVEGKKSEIYLDEAFACVTFGLADEIVYSSPRRVEENFLRLLEQINERNSPLLACSTGRRHDLIGTLGKERYPGIFVFADDMDFIRQSAEQYLQQKLAELSTKNPVAYQQILDALIHRAGLTWADEIEIEAGSMPGLGSSAEVARSISVLDCLVRVNAEAVSGAGGGAGVGAGSGAASGSFLDSASDAQFSEWIKPLKVFVMGRLGAVGLVKAGEEGTGDFVAAEARRSYQEKLNQSLPEDDVDLARDFLGRLPVALVQEKVLSLHRVAYLFKTYPTSSAVAFVRAQDPSDLVALGETASQLSGYLDSLKETDYRGIISEEQEAAVSRFREALLPLRNNATKTDVIGRMLTPEFREAIRANQALVEDFIRVRSSSRNAFIGSFFALYANSHSEETRSGRSWLITQLIKELLSKESPVTDQWMEAYQATHRKGVVLTLDPQTVNLILLHALRTPVSEQTPAFNETLTHILAFIRRSFAEKAGDATGGLAASLKASSYPEELLALIESGGCLVELYFIHDPFSSESFINAVNTLFQSGLTDEIKHLTVRKVNQVEILSSILDYSDYSFFYIAKNIKDKVLETFLAQADLMDRIKKGELSKLFSLICKRQMLTKRVRDRLFADPVSLVAKIKNSTELYDLITILGSRRFHKERKALMESFMAQEDLMSKVEPDDYQLSFFINCSFFTGVSIKKCLADHPEWVTKVGSLPGLNRVITALKEVSLINEMKMLVRAFFASGVDEEKIKNTENLIAGVSLLKTEGFTTEVRMLLQAFLTSSLLIGIQNSYQFFEMILLFKAEGFDPQVTTLLQDPRILSNLLGEQRLTELGERAFRSLLQAFKDKGFLFEMALFLETKIKHNFLKPLVMVQALKQVGLSDQAKGLLIRPAVIAKIPNVAQCFTIMNISFAGFPQKEWGLFEAFLAQEDVIKKIHNITQLKQVVDYRFKVKGVNSLDILEAFVASRDCIPKIINGEELAVLISLLKEAGLKAQLGRILTAPEVALKIENEWELNLVIKMMIEKGVTAFLGGLLSWVKLENNMFSSLYYPQIPEILETLQQNGLVEEMRCLIHHQPNCYNLFSELKHIVRTEISTLSAEEQKTTSIWAIKALLFSDKSVTTLPELIAGMNKILNDADDRKKTYDSSLAYRLFHGRRSPKVEAVYKKIKLYFTPPESVFPVPSGAFAFGADSGIVGAGAPAGGAGMEVLPHQWGMVKDR